MQVIKSKIYSCVPCIGDTHSYFSSHWMALEHYEKGNGKESNLDYEEFGVSLYALKPMDSGFRNSGFAITAYHSREDHTFLYLVEHLTEANEIASEIKANILAYIAAPVLSTPELKDETQYACKYIPESDYDALIEKYIFIHSEITYWPGQGEQQEVPQTEIFGKNKRKFVSRDCAGEIINPIVLAYNPSEPEERRYCMYEVPTMYEAIALNNQLQKTFLREGIENLKKQLNDTLKS